MSPSWFKERIGQTVLLESKDGVWRDVTIKDYKDAEKHHLMSLEGYSYADRSTVHTSDNVCIACEG